LKLWLFIKLGGIVLLYGIAEVRNPRKCVLMQRKHLCQHQASSKRAVRGRRLKHQSAVTMLTMFG